MKDILNFISSILSSVSWPLTTFFIVLLLKDPISKLIARLGKLKYGELEAEFTKGMEEIKGNIDKIEVIQENKGALPKILEDKSKKTLSEEVGDIAKISPEAAIPFAWSKVEYALNDRLKEIKTPDYSDKYYSTTKIADILLQNQIITTSGYSVINTMGKLRNSVVHAYNNSSEININDAIEYGKNAEFIINTISKK